MSDPNDEMKARERGCTCWWSNVTVQGRTWSQLETHNPDCPLPEHDEDATASAQATRDAEQE
jgi:hypothetical protein